MKIASILAISCFGFCGIVSYASAENVHQMVTPGDVKWGPAPKMLPAGAQAAVLFGDPTKEGLFALRLKLPAGYAIAPHTHPADEVVTIISGATNLGMGKTADRSATKALPAGSFFALPPETPHFVFFDEETVLQVNTNGPWGLKYINPADDPQKSQ
ncbi:cupin domain-containing protein [Arvimicrobium flavum]|uniref:cupin domain-containing protein n=1 Tax=Arvimicrobium flavum TaxID=3393320 RepID=UPI00237A4DB3|nr:cupin domain-containing protein [Mesorhizobium shangrilense]